MNGTSHRPPNQDKLHFRDFTLTPRPLRLDRDGEVVELRNQALSLLLLFVENAGELISHDDIRQHLWGDQYVDFARGTHVCIRQIRGALGDDASNPAFIETLPRQGYRFIAPVDRADIALAKDPRAAPRKRALDPVLVAGMAALAAAIGLTLYFMPSAAPNAVKADSDSPARAATLKGEYLLDTGGRRNADKSGDFFSDALLLDPDYLPARTGLAQVAILQGEFARAEEELHSVLEHDPTFAPTHMHLGIIAADRDWNWPAALSFIDQAIDLDPEFAKAHSARAAMLIILGQNEEALRATEKAHAIDPVSALVKTDHGWFHYYAGKFEAASRFCAEAEELAPESMGITYCQLKTAAATDDLGAQARAAARILARHRAEAELQEALQAHPTRDVLKAFYAWHLTMVLDYAAIGKAPAEAVAAAYASAGDFEMAASMLEKASEEHSAYLPLFLRDPIFTPLHRDPRFLAALAKAGVPAPISS